MQSLGSGRSWQMNRYSLIIISGSDNHLLTYARSILVLVRFSMIWASLASPWSLGSECTSCQVVIIISQVPSRNPCTPPQGMQLERRAFLWRHCLTFVGRMGPGAARMRSCIFLFARMKSVQKFSTEHVDA